jgi:hypothetical protein
MVWRSCLWPRGSFLLNGWHRAPKQNGKAGHICPRIETYGALQEKRNATKKGGEKR